MMKKVNKSSNDQLDSFVFDAPLNDPKSDKFNRMVFAERVAETISSLKDPSSLILSICGEWGSGKTTTMNFIREELKRKYSKEAICISFNPWNYNNLVSLFSSFFSTISDELSGVLSGAGELIKGLARKFIKIATPFTLNLPFLSVSGKEFEEVVQGFLDDQLSESNLADKKKEINDLLQKDNKKIVIFIDDIDRLDKDEVFILFKLIKLSADFSNTVYVLSYDEDMVAASLGERYAEGDIESGRSFLEKIINVPLHLPRIPKSTLKAYCLRAIDDSLKVSNIEFTQEEVYEFIKLFDLGILPGIENPRICNRIKNILTFSLPLVKGEVNLVEFVIVEGLRAAYPRLYDHIRCNSDLFLSVGDSDRFVGDDEQANKIKKANIEKGFDNLGYAKKNAAMYLLGGLFPGVKTFSDEFASPTRTQKNAEEEKRISSAEYFDRYFAFSVPAGDISDVEIEIFIEEILVLDFETIGLRIKNLIRKGNVQSLLHKLRRKEDHLEEEISKKLAISIARNGHIFSSPDRMHSALNPDIQAAMHVSQLINRIGDDNERIELAFDVIRDAEPIDFACELYKWIGIKDREGKEEKWLSESKKEELGKILAKRIGDIAITSYIPNAFKENTSLLLHIWAKHGSKNKISECFAEKLEEDESRALILLEYFTPSSWGLDNTPLGKISFEKRQYENLESVLDPEVVYKALKKKYKNELDCEKYPEIKESEITLAQQFAYIHNSVKREREEELRELSEDN